MGADAYPLGVVILVGVVALAFGMLAGASLLRGTGWTRPVVAARREWARAKLRTVFGIGSGADEAGQPPAPLVPPDGASANGYAIRTADSGLEQSADLLLRQPRRSGWARDWLYGSQVFLQTQAVILHAWMHALGREAAVADDAWQRADEQYVRRVHRVESTLALWADGHWITHSSLRLRLTNRRPFWNRRLRRSLLIPSAPAAILRGEYPPCDCATVEAEGGGGGAGGR